MSKTALALLLWMALPIHRMTFVAMPSCAKLKWVPCDFYGRIITPKDTP